MTRHTHLLFVYVAAVVCGTTTASAETSAYFGRWTAAQDKYVSSNAKFYQTIDIAACEKDYCGVSVDADGKCGATLFRILSPDAYTPQLLGHSQWGNNTLKVAIVTNGKNEIILGLGDEKFSFIARWASIPTFSAKYKNAGEAKCKVDATS